MNMSLPISRFFIPTKQGKIYAGILAVIVILVSWIMTVNSLIYIDHYPCYEDAICMRPTVVPVRERGTDYSTLFWGLFVGSFFILLILFSSTYFKKRDLKNGLKPRLRLYESYYLFLYFSFLWYFILASFFVIFFGYEMRFMPLYVRNTSIGSLIAVILVTAIGYLILRKSNRATRNNM